MANNIGFEGVEMNPQDRPAVGFEGITPPAHQLYPSLDGGDQRGPTPVESPGSAASASNVHVDAGANGKIEDRTTEITIDEERRKREAASGVTSKELEAKREALFFQDGKRRIDYVLAYKEDEKDKDKTEKAQRREVFQRRLTEEGIELETEPKEMSRDGKTCFIKVHAPWSVLSRMAEILSFKMPIEEYDSEDHETTQCCPKVPSLFEISEDLVPPEPEYFTADFSREREEMFIIKDKDTFFTNSQRSLCVHELLMRTRYDDVDESKIGIDRLVKQGVYTAAYPLHEGRYKSEESLLTKGPKNDRHLLYETWARPGRWYCYQPLDLVRRYFGEKIGIYFAWLGFYTQMLIPASIVGLVCFIYGCATIFNNVPSNDICDKNKMGNTTMCPLCDKRCSYWRLVDSCIYARITYVFDNAATVFFAGFMALWATFFLEFWKRKQAEIQYDWDVANFELEEHMRPDFEAKCSNKKQNPITKTMEPYLPTYSKLTRKCTSFFVVVFMICLVVAAVFGVIMYRIIVVATLYSIDQRHISANAKLITTVTAAVLNLIVILILNRVYLMIAVWLTEMERPRTDTEHEDSFTVKMYLFQFVNFYSSIFYIAFFKGRLTGRPGAYDFSLGYRQEECDPAGCLIELCIQLFIVMVGKQVFNNFKELGIPKLKVWFRTRKALKTETEDNLYTRWEQDNDLDDLPPLGLFDEYLEMVLQYGFVTIFVAAFPLAPLFALLNNVIEIRLDAYKFCTQWKRPPAVRAQDIGIWYGILKGVTFLAVLSNAFIIGWTSEFIPKLVYTYSPASEAGNLVGYMNFSLSYFNTSDFQERSVPEKVDPSFGKVQICRYSDFREPYSQPEGVRYEYTKMYWNVFAARLAFVIVFEHAVFFLTWVVTTLVPDIPAVVKQMMLREMFLTKRARYSVAFKDVHSKTD